MTNETCGHVDDTDIVDPFEVLWPEGSHASGEARDVRIRLAKEALADAGYQIVPIQRPAKPERPRERDNRDITFD